MSDKGVKKAKSRNLSVFGMTTIMVICPHCGTDQEFLNESKIGKCYVCGEEYKC